MEYLIINFNGTYELFDVDKLRKDSDAHSSGAKYNLKGICSRVRELENIGAQIVFFSDKDGVMKAEDYKTITVIYASRRKEKLENFLTKTQNKG